MHWNIFNLSKNLITIVYFIFPQNKVVLHTFPYFLISLCYIKCQNILVNVLVHILKNLSFELRCPSFLLSKFASQLKLIQSVVRVGILVVCDISSILRVLLSGFWVSGSQVPSLRDPTPGPHIPGSHFHSRVLGVRVLCPRIPESRVPESRVSGS